MHGPISVIRKTASCKKGWENSFVFGKQYRRMGYIPHEVFRGDGVPIGPTAGGGRGQKQK